MSKYTSLIILVFLTINFHFAFAQKGAKEDLKLWGYTVDADGKKLAGVNVKVYSGLSVFGETNTSKDGKFTFYLPLDADYYVFFEKNKMVTKQAWIDTKDVPEKDRKWGFEHGPFKMKMLPEYPDVNYSILDQPVLKISYNTNENWFDIDKQYTKKIQKALTQFNKEVEAAQEDKAILQKGLDDDYDLAIEDADLFFEEEDYENALYQYEAALRLRPEESYPKDQMKAIHGILDRTRSLEEKYFSLIERGELAIELETWTEAKDFFTQANELKPEETYPPEALAMINGELEAIALARSDAEMAEKLAAENRKNYENAMKRAERAEKEKRYDEAIANYEEATVYLPERTEPDAEIERIEGLLIEIDEQYQAKIAKADELYLAQNYADAKVAYQAALDIKYDAYAQTQINGIDMLLESEADAEARAALEAAELEKKEKTYNNIMTLANGMVVDENYSEAKEKFAQASELFPERVEPKDGIAKVEGLVAAALAADQAQKAEELLRKQNEEAYNAKLEEANELFTDGDYSDARIAYQAALALNSSADYPQQRIAEIDNLLAEKAQEEAAQQLEEEKQASLDALIKEGDDLLTAKDLDGAKAKYSAALAMFGTNRVAQERLSDVNQAIEEKKQLDAYNKANDTEFNSQLANEYKQGKTESTKKEGDKTVTTIIIVSGNRGDEYIKEEYSWGQVFYKKNGKPYNERNWKRETK